VRRFCPGVSALSAAPRRFISLPENRYWDRWLTTHVFYTGGRDADTGHGMGGVQLACLPLGWSARTVTLSHCSTGGATSGVWSLVAWYPPFCEVPTPLPVVADMWFPLWCYVNDREHASPHIGKQPAVVAALAVVRSEGLVQLCGLFPASDRSARVLVLATSSPTGLGSRSLSLMELGGLWDIPISVIDSPRRVRVENGHIRELQILWVFRNYLI